jgi:hypothetical protein
MHRRTWSTEYPVLDDSVSGDTQQFPPSASVYDAMSRPTNSTLGM